MPDSLPANSAPGASPDPGHPKGWLHKFFGWLKMLRQLSVQGMTASNSTHMPQHDDPEPEEKK